MFKTKKYDFKKISEDFEKELKQKSEKEHNKAKSKKLNYQANQMKNNNNQNPYIDPPQDRNERTESNMNVLVEEGEKSMNEGQMMVHKGSYIRHYSNFSSEVMRRPNVS